MPLWADGKDDAWEALAKRWTGEDAEFAAVSARNKKNRGTDGTHSGGNLNHGRFKERLVCIYMELPAFISRHIAT